MTKTQTGSALRITTPTTLEGADKLVGVLDTAQARLDSLEADADAQIAEIKEQLRRATENDRGTVGKVMGKLLIFADTHRELIEVDGAKSVQLTNGTLALRLGNITAVCKDDDRLVELLERMGLEGYVRTHKSVDRELLISERATLPKVPGLSFVQRERLHVKPVGASEVTKTHNVKL